MARGTESSMLRDNVTLRLEFSMPAGFALPTSPEGGFMPAELRIFQPPDTEPPAPLPKLASPKVLKSESGSSLLDYFNQEVYPEKVRRKPMGKETHAEYLRHLKRWNEYWENPEEHRKNGQEYRTASPVLKYPTLQTASTEHLEVWQEHLQGVLATSRNVNKHLGSIEAVLRHAAKKGKISTLPSVERLEEKTAAKKFYLDYSELSSIYDSCHGASWPDKAAFRRSLYYPPSHYWRAAEVMYANYGLRTQELIRHESRMTTLCWQNISWETQTPAEDGKAECKWGWMHYIPQKQKGAKPEPLVLPLNEITHLHLRSIEPVGGGHPDRPVFDFPLTSREFYKQWNAICEDAGVKPKRSLKTGEEHAYQVKHLRKTCTTWQNYYTPGIAPYITGHAVRSDTDSGTVNFGRKSEDGKVVSVHYDNVEMAVLDAVLAMPQPDAFYKIRNVVDSQMRLF